MPGSINCTILGPDGNQLPRGTTVYVQGFDDYADGYPVTGLMQQDGRLGVVIPADFKASAGLNLTIIAPGCAPWTGRALTPPTDGQIELENPETHAQQIVQLVSGPNPFRSTPQAPTRAQVCGVQMTFSGLTVTTRQFGSLPWFEPAYQCLTDPTDRASVRRQKKAAGDTHLILEFFTNQGSIYDEPSQPYQGVISLAMEQQPQFFRSLVEEVIQDGLIPLVVFDGDDGDNPMGHPNALRQLPIIASLLGDLAPYILFGRLWDGVFYGSSPEHIAEFGAAFRRLLPTGYLCIEHQPGRIPVGNGGADYAPGGLMADYDAVLSEFDTYGYRSGQSWEVLARMVRPYHRPSDQPSGDDPNPPFYLVDSARGPRFYCAFELGAYEWVRSQISVSELQQAGAYLRGMGATHVCLP